MATAESAISLDVDLYIGTVNNNDCVIASVRVYFTYASKTTPIVDKQLVYPMQLKLQLLSPTVDKRIPVLEKLIFELESLTENERSYCDNLLLEEYRDLLTSLMQ